MRCTSPASSIGSGLAPLGGVKTKATTDAVMSTRFSALLIALLASGVPRTASALWARDGVRVAPCNNWNSSPHLVSDGKNGVIVAWMYSYYYYDIRAKRLTGTGAIASGWPSEGVTLFADSTYTGSYYVSDASSDGHGGALVLFSAVPPTSGGRESAGVRRVTMKASCPRGGSTGAAVRSSAAPESPPMVREVPS